MGLGPQEEEIGIFLSLTGQSSYCNRNPLHCVSGLYDLAPRLRVSEPRPHCTVLQLTLGVVRAAKTQGAQWVRPGHHTLLQVGVLEACQSPAPLPPAPGRGEKDGSVRVVAIAEKGLTTE